MLRQLFDTVNGKYQKSKKIATDSNYLRCHALLTALHFPLETTWSCKQDRKERYWGQQFWQMARDISVRPTEMTRPVTVDHLQSWSYISVGPNRNGPFHLMYKPKLPEFWVEWKAPPYTWYNSLVPRPVRAIRVTRGGLEPSAIARGLAKNGKKVPDQLEKVPDNFSTRILCFLRRSRNISGS